MKLFRYGALNEEKTGILIDDVHYDTSDFGEDYDNNFLASEGLGRLKNFLQKIKQTSNQSHQGVVLEYL